MDKLFAAERSRSGSPYVSEKFAASVLKDAMATVAKKVRGFSMNRSVRDERDRAYTTLMTAKVVETGPNERVAILTSIGDSKAYIERADGRLDAVHIRDGGALDEWTDTGFRVVDRFSANPNKDTARRVIISQDEAFLIEQSAGLDSFRKKWEAFQESSGVEPSPERWDDLRKMHDFYFERGRKKSAEMMGEPKLPEIRTATARLNPGDKLRLFSDGIPDNLTKEEMEANIHRLTAAALERMNDPTSIRAKKDDATQVMLAVESAAVPLSLPEQSRLADERDQKKIDELRKKLELTG